jgi:hypothetical protein
MYNTESLQLYPVFPWGIYGVGKPDFEYALNTWKFDPDVTRFRDYTGWEQDNIIAPPPGVHRRGSSLNPAKNQMV